ncbi:endonuclease III [Scrofimicrobium sp. R131]|uniref:Endonuclease III n=1 Tax=Scrofimicrobium appendicitidis TaxID=3079930 RepID=A0AAU7V7Z5_9ACTO
MTSSPAPRPAPAPEVVHRLEATYPDAMCALHFSNAYELLVATVLSAQTTDVRVNQISPALFARYPNAAALAGADRAELEAILRPLGMFRRRADQLLGLAATLLADFGGEVPGERSALVSLPGVGRKTANVVLGNWFGAEEITVDTHVGRVSRRLGWTAQQNPLKVEADLRALLPDAPWTKLCHQLILLGREVCHSRGPDCENCPLVDICPQLI